MYCVNGNSSWYSDCGPLFRGCPRYWECPLSEVPLYSQPGGGSVSHSNNDWVVATCEIEQTVFFLL